MTVHLVQFFLVLLAVKVALNGYRYMQCRSYLATYLSYVRSPDGNWGWAEATHQVMRLFKYAGVEDAWRPYSEPIGYFQLATGQLSVLDNLANTRQDIVAIVCGMFHQTIGVYRSRAVEAFNPLYWVEAVVTLPRLALGFLGLPPEHVVTKLAQLVYWAASLVLAFLYSLFRPQLEQWVRAWISRLRP
jgi:hypothetical protein